MGADLGVLARRPGPGGDGAAGHKRIENGRGHVRSPNSAVFPPSQHVRPARCRPYPCWAATDRRVLEGYRRVDQHIAGPGQSAASLGGLGCLQAAPVVLPGDCRHGVRILVRVRVCASKQPSATAARSWIWAHRASTSRHPGAGRNVITLIRPACSVMKTPFLTHPGQPPALPRCPHGGRSSPDAPAGVGVRQLDRIRKDVTR